MKNIILLPFLLLFICSCSTKEAETTGNDDYKTYQEFYESLTGKWRFDKEVITDIDSTYSSPEGTHYIEKIKTERFLSIGCADNRESLLITLGDSNRFISNCGENEAEYYYTITHKDITLSKGDVMIMYDYKITDGGQLEITGDDQEFTRKVYFNKVKESH